MEFAGSLGDLGTMLPLLIPLVVLNGVNATIALALVGLFYVVAGLYYRIPVPVQPLKAVAAIAIAGGFSATMIAASGLIVGALMLVLGLTGLIDQVARIFSKPVIRGIQVTLGLLLFIKGIQFIIDSRVFMSGETMAVVPFNIFIGAMGLAIAVMLFSNKRFPAAIAVVLFGFVVGLSLKTPEIVIGPQVSALQMPALGDLQAAFLLLVIPQIPLTISNSVISTSDLAKKYFKKRGRKATHRALCTGIGVANIGAGAFGGMPMCHGSGGLAAHYRFGARTGGCNLMIGGLFIALALLFGASATNVLGLIPLSILGVLLLFTGFQMMRLMSDLKGEKEFFVVLVIIGLTLAVNMTAGFIAGIVLYYLLRWRTDEKGEGRRFRR